MEMKKEHKVSSGLILLNFVATVLILLIVAQLGSVEHRNYELANEGLTVSQEEEKEVLPDEVTVVLSIITEGESPQEVIAENTEINNELINYFKGKYEVETTSYRLNKKQKWDRENNTFIDVGYVAQNTISITSKELDKTGEIINSAISLGANSINNIHFTVSNEKLKEVQEELLQQAIANAKEKAEFIAKESGVKLGRIKSITPLEAHVYPIRYAAGMEGLVEEKAIPQIEPEKLTIRYSVNIVFEID